VPGEPSSTNRSQAAAQFFLAEFGALQQAHTVQLIVRDRQLNLYVILAAAISAASIVGLAMVRAGNEQRFLVGVGVALIAFAVLGLILAYRAIQAQLSSVVYLRAMSRIRRYFITVNDAALEPYLVLPINDDEPRFSEIAAGGVVGHLLQRDILAFINAWAVSCSAPPCWASRPCRSHAPRPRSGPASSWPSAGWPWSWPCTAARCNGPRQASRSGSGARRSRSAMHGCDPAARRRRRATASRKPLARVLCGSCPGCAYCAPHSVETVLAKGA
jgi:hypothetical protein